MFVAVKGKLDEFAYFKNHTNFKTSKTCKYVYTMKYYKLKRRRGTAWLQ